MMREDEWNETINPVTPYLFQAEQKNQRTYPLLLSVSEEEKDTDEHENNAKRHEYQRYRGIPKRRVAMKHISSYINARDEIQSRETSKPKFHNACIAENVMYYIGQYESIRVR
jgi:hypothetical protein